MAGDWIPIRKDLDRCREVAIIVEQTQLNVNEVIGQLVRFWSWVDGETCDGWLSGATEKTLEIASGICPQVIRSLSEVDWIEILNEGIQIANYEHWFGQSAKRRLSDAKRKRSSRLNDAKRNRYSRQQMDSSARRPQLVRKTSGRNGTTEQKKREHKRTEHELERLEINPNSTDAGESARPRDSVSASRNCRPEGLNEHPAVVLYWQRFGKRPSEFVQERIAQTIRDDLPGWKAVLDHWELNHHRPESIGKMLDRYREVLEVSNLSRGSVFPQPAKARHPTRPHTRRRDSKSDIL